MGQSAARLGCDQSAPTRITNRRNCGGTSDSKMPRRQIAGARFWPAGIGAIAQKISGRELDDCRSRAGVYSDDLAIDRRVAQPFEGPRRFSVALSLVAHLPPTLARTVEN